jgi:hypothetical protein
MKIKFFHSFEEYKSQLHWHLWYAWHPVWVEGTLVWLENVYRKRSDSSVADWDYRTVE